MSRLRYSTLAVQERPAIGVWQRPTQAALMIGGESLSARHVASIADIAARGLGAALPDAKAEGLGLFPRLRAGDAPRLRGFGDGRSTRATR